MMNDNAEKRGPWTRLSWRIAYEDPWVRVREDKVIRPDGSKGLYGVVEMNPSVAIAAVDEHERVAIVDQWRYVHNRVGKELPSGTVDSTDSSIEAAAKRELLEETGISAETWTYLGEVENSNGSTTDMSHLFLATNLTVGEKPSSALEPVILSWLPLSSAVDMAVEGTIREGPSVALLLKIALSRGIHRQD